MVQVSYFSVFSKIITATAFRGLGAIATLLMTLSITRNFSSHVAGNVLFGIAIITVFGQILTFGCHNTATKITGSNAHNNNWAEINQDISAFIGIIIVTGSISLVLSTLIPFAFPGFTLKPSALVIGAISAALIQLFTGALIGVQKQNSATLFLNGLTPLFTGSLIIYFSVMHAQLNSQQLVWLYVASAGFTLLFTIARWYTQSGAAITTNASLSTATKEHAQSLYPVVLAQLSTQYSSQFALAYFLSEANFAYFSSALRTSLLVSFILMAANLVVAGKFAEFYAKGEIEKINKLALLSSRLLLLIAIPLAISVILFSDRIMTLFGDDYSAGSMALQILVIGQLINVATGSTNYLLSMCGQEKSLRKVLFITLIIAISTSIILTPYYGINGAALATAIAVASQNLLATRYVQQYLGFNSLNIFRKIKSS